MIVDNSDALSLIITAKLEIHWCCICTLGNRTSMYSVKEKDSEKIPIIF